MGRKGRAIPERWEIYKPMGTPIPGTRFMACKVPLKSELLKNVPADDRFCVDDLINAHPNIGLVIDLTNTDRYYSKLEVIRKDILYEKMNCLGQALPPTVVFDRFASVVDRFLKENEGTDSIIAVHCTHGINRTGYLICRYMIQKLNMSPDEAVKNFEIARGYPIERLNYVYDLKNGCKGGSDEYYAGSNKTKINWTKYRADDKRERREAIHRYQKVIMSNKQVKKPPVNSMNMDPMCYNGIPQETGYFAKGDSRYYNADGRRPIPGSWRDEQRDFQNRNLQAPYNIHPNRIPNPFFHTRGPPPQTFHPRGPPPQTFHPMSHPRHFHPRDSRSFPPQLQQSPRPSFSPQFNKLPDNQPPVDETPGPTAMPGGFSKVYSPQVRLPAPSTSNPRPEGPQERASLLAEKRKRWPAKQRAPRKQKINP